MAASTHDESVDKEPVPTGTPEGDAELASPSVSPSLPIKLEADGKLEEIIEGIPSPEDRLYLEKTFIGLIERSGGAPLQADVATVIAETINRDNDHKFEYLCKKLDKDSERDVRAYNFEVQQHKDRVKLITPAFWFVLIALAVTTIGGVILCVYDRETLGASLITGGWAAVFGFLAGMNTSEFFKQKPPTPKS